MFSSTLRRLFPIAEGIVVRATARSLQMKDSSTKYTHVYHLDTGVEGAAEPTTFLLKFQPEEQPRYQPGQAIVFEYKETTYNGRVSNDIKPSSLTPVGGVGVGEEDSQQQLQQVKGSSGKPAKKGASPTATATKAEAKPKQQPTTSAAAKAATPPTTTPKRSSSSSGSGGASASVPSDVSSGSGVSRGGRGDSNYITVMNPPPGIKPEQELRLRSLAIMKELLLATLSTPSSPSPSAASTNSPLSLSSTEAVLTKVITGARAIEAYVLRGEVPRPAATATATTATRAATTTAAAAPAVSPSYGGSVGGELKMPEISEETGLPTSKAAVISPPPVAVAAVTSTQPELAQQAVTAAVVVEQQQQPASSSQSQESTTEQQQPQSLSQSEAK